MTLCFNAPKGVVSNIYCVTLLQSKKIYLAFWPISVARMVLQGFVKLILGKAVREVKGKGFLEALFQPLAS